MAIDIGGVPYFFATDVAKEIGVSRQTLWRWRRSQAIPAGHINRKKQVLYTEAERLEVIEYANRLVPAATSASDELEADRKRERP